MRREEKERKHEFRREDGLRDFRAFNFFTFSFNKRVKIELEEKRGRDGISR